MTRVPVRGALPARALLAALMALVLTAALAVGMSPPIAAATDGPADIDPALIEEVSGARQSSDEPLYAVLVASDQPALTGLSGTGRDAVEELKAAAAVTEDAIARQIEEVAEQVPNVSLVRSFWIQNMVLVEVPREAAALETLAIFDGVDRIVANFEVQGIEPEATGADVEAATVEDRTWGLDRVQAHRVHDELGLDGSGIRVATLDTGVAIDHPDLADKMVNASPGDPAHPGGWMEFDATGGLVASEPHDSSDHGTHVAGTIHGGDASGYDIGVAPGAEMMHGMVIPGGSGEFVQVAAGMQWAIDPTDANGNPVGEPADIVNMSLGGAAYVQEMVAPTQAMVAADVFPAFAIGNAGLFGCGVGSSSPGNVYEAVGVGATDIDDDVASFSCGNVVPKSGWDDPPAEWPDEYVKPELSAPGVDTYSTLPDGSWDTKSGTSMATPHVAGTVALMRQAAPELAIDVLEQQLIDTSFFDDRHGEERPNPRYGHGRIDAYEAVLPISIDSGIEGTVTDADSGEPIAGAEVEIVDGPTLTTAADGSFTARLQPGTYDLTATAFGYGDAAADGVVVTEDTFTTVELQLEAAPVGAVEGAVVLGDSGQGVPGVEVSLEGTPLDATTGTDGTYTIAEVPEGTYTVSASSPSFPAPPSQEVTVVAGESVTADFSLDAPADGISLVSSDPGGQFVDFFAERGIDLDVYSTSELDEAADGYRTVIWGYNTAAPGEEAFAEFLDATDASGAGVILLDAAFGAWNGIGTLSTYTGNPEEVSTSTTGSGASVYEVTAEHPILDGYEPGDRFVHDEVSSAPWIAWFDGYEGDGREVVAEMARSGDDDTVGGGIAVHERETNRHVLLSSHASSATRGPAEWSEASEQVFWDAITWASPEPDPDEPRFVASSLEVEPDVVLGDEPVEVTVDVTNIGGSAGSYDVRLRVDSETEDTTTVTLEPGETTEVAWTVTRDEVGTYTVAVDQLSDTFTVRPPDVTVSVHTVEGTGATPEPLDGASVEIVDGDDRVEVGTTDEDGELTFASTGADEAYTIVVRRDATDDHEHAYLLTRPVEIDDDTTVELRPRTSAGLGSAAYVWDQSAVVDLAVTPVDDDHEAVTYVRHTLTGPYGYAIAPGSLVTTVTDLEGAEAVHVHRIDDSAETGRDWWAVSELVDGLVWADPVGYTHEYGGAAEASLSAIFTEGTQFEATWDLTDAFGTSFAVVLETGLQPFDTFPAVLPLEDVEDAIRVEAPEEAEVLLRLRAPDGTALHTGGLSWDQRTVTRDLADHVEQIEPGAYTLELEVETGAYGGTVTASDSLTFPAATRTLASGEVVRGEPFEVTLTFTPEGDEDVELTEAVETAAADVAAIGNGWPVTAWDASVDATYDDAGTWSFAAEDLTADEPVTLTYTALSPLNVVVPSAWELVGQLTTGDDTHPTRGDSTLQVVAG